jgi:hypothetical protein
VACGAHLTSLAGSSGFGDCCECASVTRPPSGASGQVVHGGCRQAASDSQLWSYLSPLPAMHPAVPVAAYWWDANISAPVICPVATYCLGGSRAAAPVACGGNMTSPAGSTAEVDCVPLPGFHGAPAQLSPADHYSVGGSRTAAPVACGTNLLSPAGSAAFADCGELAWRLHVGP